MVGVGYAGERRAGDAPEKPSSGSAPTSPSPASPCLGKGSLRPCAAGKKTSGRSIWFEGKRTRGRRLGSSALTAFIPWTRCPLSGTASNAALRHLCPWTQKCVFFTQLN